MPEEVADTAVAAGDVTVDAPGQATETTEYAAPGAEDTSVDDAQSPESVLEDPCPDMSLEDLMHMVDRVRADNAELELENSVYKRYTDVYLPESIGEFCGLSV